MARRPISTKWRLPQGQGQGTGGEGQGVEGCTKMTREERQVEMWTQCGRRCGLSIAEARDKTQQKQARLE